MITEIPPLPDGLLEPENLGQLKNEPLLEYVWTVAGDLTCKIYDIDHLIACLSEDPKENSFANRFVATFVGRIYHGEVGVDEGVKSKYLDPDEPPLRRNILRLAMEKYGLDEAKWWYLMLFLKDYVEDMYMPEAAKTPMERVEELLGKMDTMEPSRDKFSAKLTFQSRGGKGESGKRGTEDLCISDRDAIMLIRYLLKKGVDDLKARNIGQIGETGSREAWVNSIHLNRVLKPDKDHAYSEENRATNVTDKACEYWRCLNVILKDHKLPKGESGDKYALAAAYFFMFGLTTDNRYEAYLKVNSQYNPVLKNILASGRRTKRHFLHRIYLWSANQ